MIEHKPNIQLERAGDEISINSSEPGRAPTGTITDFLSMGIINEGIHSSPYQEVMLKQLLKGHESIIDSLRANIDAQKQGRGEAGTTGFLINLMKQQEAIVCILKSYMNKHQVRLSFSP